MVGDAFITGGAFHFELTPKAEVIGTMGIVGSLQRNGKEYKEA